MRSGGVGHNSHLPAFAAQYSFSGCVIDNNYDYVLWFKVIC